MKTLSHEPVRVGRRFGVVTLAVAMAAFGAHTLAQSLEQMPGAQAGTGFPNYDIRFHKVAAADYLDRVVDSRDVIAAGALAGARIAGIARLQGAGKSMDVAESRALGSIETLSAKPGTAFLTGRSTDRVAALRGFLSGHADAYGLTGDQVETLELVTDYVNPAGNMAWVEFAQRLNGLPVFQGFVRGAFTARGELARTTGPLAPGLSSASLPTSPGLTAARAVSRAAATVGWQIAEQALAQKAAEAEGRRVTFDRGVMADDPRAWLLYFPLAPGVARLAWATEIWGNPDVYLVVTDAEDGTLLFRKNLTNYQTQSATYHVYNADSPAPMSPTQALPGTNTQGTYISRTPQTLIGNEPPNVFNDLGWMTDNTNGVNGHTDGNNVEAGMDRMGGNDVDAPAAGVNRVFNYAYNPATDDPLTPTYQGGEATQMFYWTNMFHDRTYLLGFTEAARNFQHDNFGRGGLGLDRISAEGQDSSGTNNANFATPPDGGRGKMQMYRFTRPTPDRSSGLDQDILIHELTHGLSNRLHGNAEGLGNNMSRGMGEGWSDFYARALLSTADEDVNGVYAMAGWATHSITGAYTDNYYYGIRRFPLAVKTTLGGNGQPHNPLTFADIDATQIYLNDGAYPRGPIGSNTADQVHNVGEVWATALFEVRARFISRLGFAVGNQRILQFVTDGMKLDPLVPTLLQGRDAIIAAASAGGGTPADITDIWAGFATRGMGVLASIPNIGPYGNGDGTTRVIENFNVPGDSGLPSFSVNNVSVTEGNAGTTSASFTVTLANAGSSERRVSYITSEGTATSGTFTSAGLIHVPGSGTGSASGAPAAPYPAAVNVSGLTGTVTRVKVVLHGVRHPYPADFDVLLVGPTGARVMVMSDVGSQPPAQSANPIAGIDLTLDDGAPPMTGAALVSGTYAPTDGAYDDGVVGEALPAPAPGPPYSATFAAAFNGTNPNGTWSLYAVDDFNFDPGSIDRFSVMIDTATNDFVAVTGQLVFRPGTSTQSVNVTINGDALAEGDDSFFVNLVSPVNAVIGDAQGLGIILNDDGVGAAPTPVNDAYATPANTPLIVGSPGVLANDISNGGGTMSAVLLTGARTGAVALAPDGGFTYTPNPGFTGVDSFSYRADNTIGPGTTATVTIGVAAGLQPTIGNDAYSVAFETTLLVPLPGVLGNDGSNGGGAMSADLVTSTVSGTLSLGVSGGFTYTPNVGFVGADSFTYRAVNGIGAGNIATVSLTVNPPTTPQLPTELYVSSIAGNVVTLRWKAATLGPVASQFVLEGGFTPGQVLASLPTGSDSPIFTFTAPTGAFYARVHQVTGANRSDASNEIRLFVNVPQPPSAPAALVGLVNGSNLGLAWLNTFAGGEPTAVTLDVNGPITGSIPLGLADAFSFAGVPGGTYTLSVRATNATGTSGPSNPLTLTFPGPCSEAPMPSANFLAYRLGATTHVVWDPAPAGPATTSYVLNVSGSFAGSFHTTARQLSGVVPTGTYNLSLTSVNACGSATTAVQTLRVP